MPTLHLVIPFFNEAATLETSVDRVRQQTLPAGWGRKIILVDDGSSETSAAIGRALALDHEDISLVRLDENCGKGAAVRLGLAAILERADEADAVALANDTAYGLSGSIWTDNLSRALRVSRAVEAGNLSVNSHSSVRYNTPFGGFKASGLGRELGPDAPLSFTETKNVFIAVQAEQEAH